MANPHVNDWPERPREPAAATAGHRKRRRNAEKTRRDILLAAGQRFARHGYSQVTLREIADDVGVTSAMVVRYFGTKLALFEEVAKGSELILPPLEDGDRKQQLIARARAVLSYYEDNATLSGIALLRSLDLDDGELFRSELTRRMERPWASEITGPDAGLRLQLVAGLLLGVGMFSLGALIDPDRPTLSEDDADRLVRYLAEMFAVCLDPEVMA